MVKKLTDDEIKSLKSDYLAIPKDDRKPLEVRDTEVRGLTLRFQPSGCATFFLQFRDTTGKQGRIRIGRYGNSKVDREIGLPKARELAKDHLANITQGKNPADEKREAREERKQPSRDLTLRQFLDDIYGPWAIANLKSHGPTLIRLRAGFAPLLDKKLVDLGSWDFESNRMRRAKEKRFHPKKKGAKEAKPRKPPSKAGINRDQMTMRAALAKAVEWNKSQEFRGCLIDVNPLDGVKKAREDKNQSIRAMTPTEEADILDAFAKRRAKLVEKWQAEARKPKKGKKTVGPPIPRFLDYFEVMIIVSLDCGLRRGEALGLLWSDVDFADSTIVVRGEGAKSSQTRKIPMTPRVQYHVLNKWSLQTGGEGRVFPGASVDSIRAKWRVLLTDAKVTGLRWHDLRHTFATRLVMKGVALPVVQKLMGHASITTTARYLHSTDADARAAIGQVVNGKGE